MDIAALSRNMALLQHHGLADLNKRLIQAKTKIFDTLAEHNLAAMMVRHFGQSAHIGYEMPGHGPRPIDFQVEFSGHTFRLQMKRLASLEAENRRNQILERIERDAAQIAVPKFFSIDFAESFSNPDVPQLIAFLRAIAKGSEDGVDHTFPDATNPPTARMQFWSPRKLKLKHLTLGSSADMEPVNITGCAADQIRSSLRNAAGAFVRPADDQNVSLVVAEADRHHDVDLGDACFGTEYEWEQIGGRGGWARQQDGVFRESNIAGKLVGLISLRRRERNRPISEYEMTLYINEPHTGLLPLIRQAFPIARVIHYNMRP